MVLFSFYFCFSLTFPLPSIAAIAAFISRSSFNNGKELRKNLLEEHVFQVPIIDAVVAAHILNSGPCNSKADQQSYWKDSRLSKDVKIIKDLPRMGNKLINPHTTRVPRKCNAECYKTRIAVRLTKFDYRLSNRLDTELQKLRCRVNYHALKFTDPIIEMGRKLVERIRKKSKHFLALHLRFESDMLAFSGCAAYGGGEKERRELGEIYGARRRLAPLKAFFPNIYTKETLASREELAPFSSFSSRMAALDFIVCDESDVFVSNNNGNMARMLAGRRRYFVTSQLSVQMRRSSISCLFNQII
ncbi:hypothetical protein HAX54_032346 [Datura stramonium]|uniref:O-fucosyltransferase family protein n=1 Tax=Datura stramonium TaxID=4076 RepID=A0ABS8VDE0_DATST|nr:hypothetical protein [Datura stramonium]